MAVEKLNVPVRDHLLAHSALVQAKEFLARLRGEIMHALTHRDVDDTVLVRIGARQALYEDRLHRFLLGTTPEIVAAHGVLANSLAMKQLEATLHILTSGAKSNPVFPPVTSEFWYVAASQVINGLKQIEDQSFNGIRREASAEGIRLNHESLLRTGLLVVFSIVILAVGLSTIIGLL
ncbi:MAG: hypothetical protein FD149_1068 [Rhodospirillaceae bacterium]|nr:MAG: hypothetical protein FD149_1068 [Rhodospirillaceae bacterium]